MLVPVTNSDLYLTTIILQLEEVGHKKESLTGSQGPLPRVRALMLSRSDAVLSSSHKFTKHPERLPDTHNLLPTRQSVGSPISLRPLMQHLENTELFKNRRVWGDPIFLPSLFVFYVLPPGPLRTQPKITHPVSSAFR